MTFDIEEKIITRMSQGVFTQKDPTIRQEKDESQARRNTSGHDEKVHRRHQKFRMAFARIKKSKPKVHTSKTQRSDIDRKTNRCAHKPYKRKNIMTSQNSRNESDGESQENLAELLKIIENDNSIIETPSSSQTSGRGEETNKRDEMKSYIFGGVVVDGEGGGASCEDEEDFSFTQPFKLISGSGNYQTTSGLGISERYKTVSGLGRARCERRDKKPIDSRDGSMTGGDGSRLRKQHEEAQTGSVCELMGKKVHIKTKGHRSRNNTSLIEEESVDLFSSDSEAGGNDTPALIAEDTRKPHCVPVDAKVIVVGQQNIMNSTFKITTQQSRKHKSIPGGELDHMQQQRCKFKNDDDGVTQSGVLVKSAVGDTISRLDGLPDDKNGVTTEMENKERSDQMKITDLKEWLFPNCGEKHKEVKRKKKMKTASRKNSDGDDSIKICEPDDDSPSLKRKRSTKAKSKLISSERLPHTVDSGTVSETVFAHHSNSTQTDLSFVQFLSFFAACKRVCRDYDIDFNNCLSGTKADGQIDPAAKLCYAEKQTKMHKKLKKLKMNIQKIEKQVNDVILELSGNVQHAYSSSSETSRGKRHSVKNKELGKAHTVHVKPNCIHKGSIPSCSKDASS